jgi:hypothetical protein
VARKHLRHLFPRIRAQPGYFKRRRRLSDTLEWLMSVFASQSPSLYDDLLLVDSTPVECARSRETVKRAASAMPPTTATAALNFSHSTSSLTKLRSFPPAPEPENMSGRFFKNSGNSADAIADVAPIAAMARMAVSMTPRILNAP